MIKKKKSNHFLDADVSQRLYMPSPCPEGYHAEKRSSGEGKLLFAPEAGSNSKDNAEKKFSLELLRSRIPREVSSVESVR